MIKDNLLLIQEKIRLAEIKAGRKADSVKLMAVSKFHPVNEIQEAIASGQTLFGENRVQEAKEKFTSLFDTNPSIQLHIIGQLQSNKVKNAVSLASCIQSLDRLDLLKEIEKQASKINKQIEVLFELHTGEESKSGYQTLEELEESLEYEKLLSSIADNNEYVCLTFFCLQTRINTECLTFLHFFRQ